MSRVVHSNEPKGKDAAETAFIKTACDRFKESSDATVEIRREALDDLKFRAGQQWPDEILRTRTEDKRPCLTINRLPNFVRQICNDQRANRPAIIVSPTGDDADLTTAEVIQGMIRHIEYDSNAEIAYDTAFERMVTSSFGYLRLNTEYEDEMSFKQVLKIKRVRNPFTVYFDPNCQEPDYSDGKWAFIISDMRKEDYKTEYPDSKCASLSDWTTIGDQPEGWFGKENIRIAEYYVVERQKREIVLMHDGAVHFADRYEKNADGTLKVPDGHIVIDKRKTWVNTVMWYKINAMEILEKTEWLGKWIPIVPILGDELDVDGKIQLEGCIRHAKDPQRMYNYWASAETEMIALAPKAPFIGAEGQFEGYEKQWQMANVKSFPFLEYKPVTLGDKLAPPPQRNTYEPAVQAITQARAQSIDDLKGTIGIYDPGLGEPGNETSGKAILARQNRSDKSNAHYMDNLCRGMKHLGRMILDLIPKIYDEARIQRIISESGVHKLVKINQAFTDTDGVKKIFDVTTGKYDVVVSTGPSYQTKRQEAAASIEQIVQAWPEIMQYVGDLLVKNMDWPGAQEIAERLKKMLPAQLQDQEPGQLSPQAQQIIQRLQNLIQAMGAEMKKMQTKIDTRVLDIQSKERIALMNTQADLAKNLMQINSKEAQTAFIKEIDHIGHLLTAFGADSGDTSGAAAAAADKLLAPQGNGDGTPSTVLPSTGNPATMTPT